MFGFGMGRRFFFFYVIITYATAARYASRVRATVTAKDQTRVAYGGGAAMRLRKRDIRYRYDNDISVIYYNVIVLYVTGA